MSHSIALILTLMMVCLALSHANWPLGIATFALFSAGAVALSR